MGAPARALAFCVAVAVMTGAALGSPGVEPRVARRAAGTWGPGGRQRRGRGTGAEVGVGRWMSEWAPGHAVRWHRGAGVRVSAARPPRGSGPELARQFVGRLEPQGCHPSTRLWRRAGHRGGIRAPRPPPLPSRPPGRGREGLGAASPRFPLFCGVRTDRKFLLLLVPLPQPPSGPSSWPAAAKADSGL